MAALLNSHSSAFARYLQRRSTRAAIPLPERPQRRSLFASMSNHIAKSVNCEPEISEQRDEHDRRRRDLRCRRSAARASTSPSTSPTRGHQDAEDVEEDERVEVADHVLLPHPPPEALEEQPRDPRHDRAQLDPRALADVVDRPRGDVAHARVLDVQVDEHVVREAVARVEPVEVEPLERARARAPCSPACESATCQ